MANISWNNTRKMIIRMIMVVATMILMCINVITVKAETKTITYNANGGTFEGGGTTNIVTYDVQPPAVVTKYSHTSNISDDGTQNGDYPNRANTNDVVTIPGASELEVTITYSGESTSYDWACVWEGNHPEYTASNNSGSSISGKLGGSPRNTQTFTISGDSVTFGFKSDSGGAGDGYGYYAVVSGMSQTITITSGEEKIPVSNNIQQGFNTWNTNPAGTGTNLSFDEVPINGSETVYAKYDTFNNIAEGDWWKLREDGTLIIGNGSTITIDGEDRPWASYSNSITHVRVYGNVSVTGSVENYFYNYYPNIQTIDLTGMDTTNVTNMGNMFDGCRSLISLNLGDNFDTSNVTDMGQMFNGCRTLKSLDLGDKFDTSNVTNMSWLFGYCTSLETLNLGNNFNTSNVTNMYYMFYNCSALSSLDVSGFNTSNVTTMDGMFSGCSTLATLDVSSFDTSNVTDMNYMFCDCKNLTALNVENFNTSNATSMIAVFQNCESLTSINVTNFNTSNVTSMDYMFDGCKSLTTLNINNFNTSNVTSMREMFSACSSLTSIDVSSFDTSNVTDMQEMFSFCTSLTSLDVSNFNTSNVTDMWGTFKNCSNLTSLELGELNTSNVTNFFEIFSGCSSLASIDVSNLDTSSATDMREMFYNCSSLTSLNLDNFDTSSAEYISYMFGGTTKLSSITLGPAFSFSGNNITGNYRKCTFYTPPSSQDGIDYTGKWIRKDKSHGPYTPEELRDNYTPAMAGEWVWEEVPSDFTIQFTKNQTDAIGAMETVTAKATQPYTIPSNLFKKFGYVFDHWDDGNGHTYENNGVIPASTYTVGSTVTLTAILVPRSTIANLQNGEMDIILMGNEKATFDNIPAGTAYQVYEETPEGWVLIEQSNASGIIQPLETADARFNNKYQPGTATIQFSGSKTLDNNAAPEDAFTFILKEGNVEIDRKSTMNGGFIQFDVIEYTDADVGTHNYTIEEVNPDNDKLIWDTHKEIITVEVSKTGSQLSAEATYDSDGIVFKNYTKPGILKIKKETEGTTEANANDEFTFNVTLNNDKGLPIDNDVQWYKEAS